MNFTFLKEATKHFLQFLKYAEKNDIEVDQNPYLPK